MTPEKDVELNNEETEHKAACYAKKWDYSANCHPIPQQEILAIVELYECFKIAPKLLRKQMTYFDSGCPNKDLVTGEEKEHALTCYTASGCTSKMRIQRAASTHFPKLHTFLCRINETMKYHKEMAEIDRALYNGNITFLMNLIKDDEKK